MDKPKTYNEWLSSLQGFDAMRHANCCRISYEAGQKSRQAEIDEKDKRIEELQAKVDAVEHVLGCAMIAPKEVFQYADRIAKALRGNDA